MSRRTSFYLDKRNKKVMGVCAGIADYTGIDVTIIRIAVAALVIFGGGSPAALYFIAGCIASDKPRDFYEADEASRDDRKFWQGVRAKPRQSIQQTRARFRELDRRLADVELHITGQNRRLADEIEALR
jgi:phage shock protein C